MCQIAAWMENSAGSCRYCLLEGSGSHLVIVDVVERTHPGTEQRDASLAVHCALEHFQSIDLPFGLAVAPWLANCVAHRVDIVS
jgi:hypothetical protein